MEWSGSTFIPQQPENSPKLTKHVQLDQKHHHKFGKPVRHHPKLTPFFTFADTGCQTCTAGMDFLYQTNCEESDTIPTKHKIVGINNTPINITGPVILIGVLLMRRRSTSCYVIPWKKGISPDGIHLERLQRTLPLPNSYEGPRNHQQIIPTSS